MTHPDEQSLHGRPSSSDYLAWIEGDARLLLDAARSAPRAPVRTCPGWTARDVADHTGEVYAHKVAAMRLGREPQEGEWPWAPDDDSVFGWFSERLAELLHELGTRQPDQTTWTWFHPDQTVGFWARRMAHESAIHRVDAELGAGRPLAPHDLWLAADGVDELLVSFLPPDEDDLQDEHYDDGSAGTVLVEAGDRRWLIELPDGGCRGRAVGERVHSDARIAGAAADVYRGLWNRPTELPVTREGDAAVLARLDARLRLVTQ